jgi:hypothetical protein
VLAVSIYEDSALIEVSSMPMEEPLDSLVVGPADKLEVIWRPVIRPRRSMEADGSHRRRDRTFNRSAAFNVRLSGLAVSSGRFKLTGTATAKLSQLARRRVWAASHSDG